MRALPARRIALGALCAALLTTITGPTAFAADSLPGQDPAASSAALLARVPHSEAPRGDLAPVADLIRAVLAAPDGQLPPAQARKLADAARTAVVRAAADDPGTVTATVTTTPTAATPFLPGLPAPVTGVLLPTAEEDDGTPSSGLGAVREALDSLLDLLLPASGQAAPSSSTTTTTTENTSTGTTEITDSTESTADASDTSGTANATDAADAAGTAADAAADASLTFVDELLARVDELLDALTATDPQTATTLPAPADPAEPADPADPADPAEPADPADPADPDEPADPAEPAGLLPALTSLILPNS
ncbi:hypothetical protein ACPCAG_13020 [Streptomyces pseudogriseolus]|uniref:hypothetical protein n=1 Tax=Streptomyces pseudogriseolus TaxID=36817 RepID=UPI003FA1C3F0